MNVQTKLASLLQEAVLVALNNCDDEQDKPPKLIVLTDGSGLKLNNEGKPIFKGTIVHSTIAGLPVGKHKTDFELSHFEFFYGNLVLSHPITQ